MENDIEISVIMGVKDPCIDKLEKSIDSIKCQTFKKWEFIICDDGSIGDIYNHLLQRYKDDCRFKIIKNKSNIGLAATMNKCLSYCNGEYIARMDDDDISKPERFEKQIDFLKKHTNYAFVSSNYNVFDGHNVYPEIRQIERPQKKDFLWNSSFVHPATMFRRKSLLEVGGYRVSKETIKGQDYDLFMRMYAKGMKGYNIQEPLFNYYINPDEKSKKMKYKYRLNEAIIRYQGFKQMNLLPAGYLYVLKPLLVGLIPVNILEVMKRKNNS